MKKVLLMGLIGSLMSMFMLSGCFSFREENSKNQILKERLSHFEITEKKVGSIVKAGIYYRNITSGVMTYYSFSDYLAISDTSFIDSSSNAYLVYKDKYVDMLSFMKNESITASSFINGTNTVKSLSGTNFIPPTVIDNKGNSLKTGTEIFSANVIPLTIKDVYAVNDIEIAIGIEPSRVLPKEATVTLSNHTTTIAAIKEWIPVTFFSQSEAGVYRFIGKIADSKFYTNPLNLSFNSLVRTTIYVTGINLSKQSIVLTIGANELLNGSVLPANAVNQGILYTSKDPSIATIDSYGKITALKKGITEIIARSAENKNITSICSVQVKSIEITKLESTITKITLKIGPCENFKVKLVPTNEIGTKNTIIWKTENFDIASVNEDGWVSGWLVGKTRVTATLKENPAIQVSADVYVIN